MTPVRPRLEVRVEVRPRWHFRLPTVVGLDRLMRRHGGVLHRLVHFEDQPVVVRVAQTSADAVLFGAAAPTRAAAEHGIARMRVALGVDQDLRPFHERFRHDPLIGAAVRADPGLRLAARPDPFEALTWAVCEQLIEYERAAAIQRRLAARYGRRCASLRAPGRADRGRDRRPRAGRAGRARPFARPRARAHPLRPRGRVWSRRSAGVRSRARVAAAAGDPRHRRLDDPDARLLGSGPRRPAPGRGPRLHQARRAAAHGRCRTRGRPRRTSRRSLRRTHPGALWRVPTRCAAARAGRRCGLPPDGSTPAAGH